jgi:hypothetical protein
VNVFELNIEIIRCIRGVDELFRRKVFTFVSATVAAVAAAAIALFVYARSA